MCRFLCGVLLGIVLAATLVSGADRLTLEMGRVLYAWDDEGGRPGLFYDRFQRRKDGSYIFWACEELPREPSPLRGR